DVAGPDRRAGNDAEGAAVGGGIIEPDLEQAAAIGAGRKHVGVGVDDEGLDLDEGQAGAEALPSRAGAAGEIVNADVGADEDVAVARVDDDLQGRHVGKGAADVGPGAAGIGGAEDVAAAEDAAGHIGGVAVARIDDKIGVV